MPDVEAPPVPVVDATPAPPPTPKAEESSAFAALDKMTQDDKPDAPAPEKDKAIAKSQAPAKAPVKAAPAKAATPPIDAPFKGKEAEVKILEEIPPNSPQWFRTHYETAKTQIKTLKTELEQAKARPATPAEDPEKNQIKETLTQREKRLSELEDEIRFVDYTKSAEYKARYHDKYVADWQNAVAEISQLTVRNPDGSERAATATDFEKLMSIANPNEALRAAGELFGDPAKAAFAMTQAGTVKQSIRAAQAAIQEFRTKGTERIKAQEAERERAGRDTTAKWKQTTEEMIEGNPEIYKPEDGDDEGNALLVKGFERADAAFGGMITEDGKQRPPTPEEMITINAEIRNKAAAFDRLAHRNTKNLSRIAELEQQIAEYEKSGPGGGSPPGERAVSDEDSFDAAVDRVANG